MRFCQRAEGVHGLLPAQHWCVPHLSETHHLLDVQLIDRCVRLAQPGEEGGAEVGRDNADAKAPAKESRELFFVMGEVAPYTCWSLDAGAKDFGGTTVAFGELVVVRKCLPCGGLLILGARRTLTPFLCGVVSVRDAPSNDHSDALLLCPCVNTSSERLLAGHWGADACHVLASSVSVERWLDGERGSTANVVGYVKLRHLGLHTHAHTRTKTEMSVPHI